MAALLRRLAPLGEAPVTRVVRLRSTQPIKIRRKPPQSKMRGVEATVWLEKPAEASGGSSSSSRAPATRRRVRPKPLEAAFGSKRGGAGNRENEEKRRKEWKNWGLVDR